jgi:hypothetical protein
MKWSSGGAPMPTLAIEKLGQALGTLGSLQRIVDY